MNIPKKFLRLPAVIELVDIKRTIIYERIEARTFPKPVQIGPRAVALNQEELVAEKPAARCQKPVRLGVSKSGGKGKKKNPLIGA